MKWTPKKLFSGRLKRTYFLLGNIAINIIAMSFLLYYFSNFRYDLYLFLWALFFILTFFLLSIICRRLHDIAKSGWWSLILFFPFINIIFIILLIFIPGTDGENRYGEVKKRGFLKEIINIK